MKKENSTHIKKLDEQIKRGKDSFRQHQRNLSFDEKMKIAFSLAERDKAIRRAFLLPKASKNKESK